MGGKFGPDGSDVNQGLSSGDAVMNLQRDTLDKNSNLVINNVRFYGEEEGLHVGDVISVVVIDSSGPLHREDGRPVPREDTRREDVDTGEATGRHEDDNEEIQIVPIPAKPAPEVIDLIDSDEEDDWKGVSDWFAMNEATTVTVVKDELPPPPPENPIELQETREINSRQEASGVAELIVIDIPDSPVGSHDLPQPFATGLNVGAIRQVEVSCLYELTKCVNERCKGTYRAPSLEALAIVAMEMPTTETNLGKLPGMSMTVRDIYWKEILKITKKYRQQKFGFYKAAISGIPPTQSISQVTPAAAEAEKSNLVKRRAKGATRSKKSGRHGPNDEPDTDSSETEDEAGIDLGSPPPKRPRRRANGMAKENGEPSTI